MTRRGDEEPFGVDAGRRHFLTKAGLAAAGVGALSHVVPVGAAEAAVDPGGRLNLKDFGAVGDGTADDGPALQRALDALSTAGGGELVIPPGVFALRTPVAKDYLSSAAALRIVGYGSASRLLVKVAPTAYAIQLLNLQHVTLQGLTFVGTPGVRNDAGVVVYFAYCDVAAILDSDFYGLGSLDNAPAAIVLAHRSDLTLERCAFRGCAADGVVVNQEWVGFRADGCFFLDYGSLNGAYHSKTPLGGGTAWMQARAPAEYPPQAPSSNGVFSVRNVRTDEGARAVLVDPGAARVTRVHLDGLNSNAPPSDVFAEAIWVRRTDVAVLENCLIGYATSVAGDGVRFSDVREALVSRCILRQQANRITADADCGTLTVVESSYTTLRSAATTTNVVNGGRGGVVPRTKAGAVSDADFDAVPPDGTLAVDTSGSRLFVRVAGAWASVALTGGPSAPAAPTVVSRSPAPGATGVALDTKVTATFSEPVQPASISFRLSDGSAPVAATVAYEDATRTATLTPSAPLHASATYTATVSGATTTTGAPMAGDVSWTFTTVAAGPPAAIGVVQKKSATAVGTGVTATLDAPPTPGNLLVVFGCVDSAVASIGDPSGFTLDASTGGSGEKRFKAWHRVVQAGDQPAVTMAISGSTNQRLDLHVLEYRGLAANPLDGTPGASTTGSWFATSLRSPVQATSGPGVVVVSYAMYAGNGAMWSNTPTDSFTRQLVVPSSLETFDRVTTAAGSYSMSESWTPGNYVWVIALSLKRA